MKHLLKGLIIIIIVLLFMFQIQCHSWKIAAINARGCRSNVPTCYHYPWRIVAKQESVFLNSILGKGKEASCNDSQSSFLQNVIVVGGLIS